MIWWCVYSEVSIKVPIFTYLGVLTTIQLLSFAVWPVVAGRKGMIELFSLDLEIYEFEVMFMKSLFLGSSLTKQIGGLFCFFFLSLSKIWNRSSFYQTLEDDLTWTNTKHAQYSSNHVPNSRKDILNYLNNMFCMLPWGWKTFQNERNNTSQFYAMTKPNMLRQWIQDNTLSNQIPSY